MSKHKTATWHDWIYSMDKTCELAREETGIFMINCDDYEQLKKSIALEIEQIHKNYHIINSPLSYPRNVVLKAFDELKVSK